MQFPKASKWVKWSLWFVLGVVLGRALATAAQTPSTAVDPASRAILDRCIEVMGGRSRLESIKSRSAKGTVEFVGAGITGEVRVQQSADGKIASVTDVGAAGRFVRGADGTHAWEINGPTGPRLLAGAEATGQIEQAKRLFIVPLGATPDLKAIRHAGVEKVIDEEFERIEVVPASGAARFWLFSKKSGHLVHEDRTEKGPGGPVVVRLTHTDFQTIDGVTSPMGAVQTVAGQTMKFQTDVKALRYNGAIEIDAFKPPAEVQKLIDAGK